MVFANGSHIFFPRKERRRRTLSVSSPSVLATRDILNDYVVCIFPMMITPMRAYLLMHNISVPYEWCYYYNTAAGRTRTSAHLRDGELSMAYARLLYVPTRLFLQMNQGQGLPVCTAV